MFLETFFAPRDAFKPCGMFSLEHIIASTITLILVVLAVIFAVKLSEKSFYKLLKILAVVFTVLELIKIIYNFSYGYTWIDAWVPLAYCSIFIYSLYLAGFGKGTLKNVGLTFLAVGVYAGLFFMIFPTTSLSLHPIFHYLCMHSLIFHGAMTFVGLTVIIKNLVTPSKKTFIYYISYLAVFSAVAIIINLIGNANLMFYTQPYNMPIKFVVDIFNFSPVVYTAFIFVAYSSLYLLFILTNKVVSLIKRKG